MFFVVVIFPKFRISRINIHIKGFQVSLQDVVSIVSEEGFKYEWNCIFPESAAQKAERLRLKSEEMLNYTTAGILSPESALAELKAYGSVSKDAVVGIDPNKLPPTTGKPNGDSK
mgnify:CR=1 FL=1